MGQGAESVGRLVPVNGVWVGVGGRERRERGERERREREAREREGEEALLALGAPGVHSLGYTVGA